MKNKYRKRLYERLYRPGKTKTPDGDPLHKVWARVGMTGYLTQEELDIINKRNKTAREKVLTEEILTQCFFLDGETYFPEEVEGNTKHITIYELDF